jgi:tRNA-Thr(GGU) m(6)t(6)A37 methyltransferase TsaA
MLIKLSSINESNMELITLSPIAIVRNDRQVIADDNWGRYVSTIELLEPLTEQALAGIEQFSHAEIIFFFDRVSEDSIEYGARQPRNNPDWPRMGILAQRGRNRPNRLGATIVRILAHSGRALTVQGLDALDGSPVIDIKPVMREFLPRGEMRQPAWVSELMQNYWEDKETK